MPTDDERPKKSWRERDKGRDRSRHTNTAADRERERFERTPGYSRYKQSLERVFAGGELSAALRSKLEPASTDADKDKDEKLKAIRLAEAPADFIKALDAFLAAHEFPDDPYLLDRALEHPKPEIQLRALGRLKALKEEGKLLKLPASLKLRLDSIALNSDDYDVQDAAKALKKLL
jgi:hypothetical protein